MIDLVVLVVSVALVDSLNPTTIVPALYLATGPHAVRSVLGFAGGFIAVNVLGGIAVLVLGHKLADLVPRPSQGHLHVGEVVLGLVAIAGAGVLWHRRRSVGAGFARTESGAHRVAPLAGATLAAVELPTAVPYLAVIAAVAAANEPFAAQLALVVTFNVLFLAPVLAIAIVRAVAGQRAVALLTQARSLALRYAGALVAGLVLVVGIVLVTLGAVGLASA